MNRKIAFFGFIIASISLNSQTLLDDLKNNNLEGFSRKLTVLDVKMDSYPFLAYYLKNASDIKVDAVRLLVDSGAAINESDDDGIRPIFFAVIRGNIDVIKYLESKNIDEDVSIQIGLVAPTKLYDFFDNTMYLDKNYKISAASLSLIYKKYDIIDHFSKDIDFMDTIECDRWTTYGTRTFSLKLYELPLWSVYGNGSISDILNFKSIVTKLNKTSDIRIDMSIKYSPLLNAVIFDDVDIMKKIMIEQAIDMNIYIPMACILDSEGILDLLLRYQGISYSSLVNGINADLPNGSISKYKDWSYQTNEVPLYTYAFLAGNINMLKYLKTKGADFSIPMTFYSFDQINDIKYYLQLNLEEAIKMLALGKQYSEL